MLVILGSAGVIAPRALSLPQAREANEQTHARFARRQAEIALRAEFLRVGGPEQIALADERVGSKLPSNLEPVEIFDVLRLVAGAHRIELDVLHVNDSRDAGLEKIADEVRVDEIDLRGRGELGDWIGMLADLEKAGYPAAVLEFRFTRENPSQAVFDVRMMLGVFHVVPPRTSAPGDAEGAGR